MEKVFFLLLSLVKMPEDQLFSLYP